MKRRALVLSLVVRSDVDLGELKPVVEKLDAAAARVSADMDDATVDELAKTALPAWHNFKFEVQRLRADYLLRRMDGQSSK